MSLSKHSTLEEVFDFLQPEDPLHDTAVHPVTLTKNDDPSARLMIIIQGAPGASHVILANLMAAVKEMYDLAEQKKATEDAKPKLVGSDGELIDGDEPIISKV